MGNTSSLIPATKVLELVASEEKSTGKAAPLADGDVPADEDKLRRELEALGVDVSGAPPSDAARCWRLVNEKDFWRNHATQHPQKKRVKSWLFVHGKFRAAASSMVGAAESMQASLASGTAGTQQDAAVKGVESSFRTLLSKIQRHSEFEDTQLFRFFKEHLPHIRDDIRDLEADHSEKQQEEKALALLKSLREQPGPATNGLATETVAALRDYAVSLEGHLDREERVLVAVWLNLTPELYAKYRTYLVGKYRLVY